MPVTEGVYFIRNAKANRLLDCSVGGDGHLLIREKHAGEGSKDQEWELHAAKTGGFNIMAVYDQRWIFCAASTKGTAVSMSKTEKTAFDIMRTEQPDAYSIYVTETERVLDLTGGNLVENTTVDLMTAKQAPTESWVFERIRDLPSPLYNNPDLKVGRYILRSTSVGTVVDLADGKKADGTAVTAQTYREGKTNQLWDLSATAKGYIIKNVASGTFLSPIPQTAAFAAGVNVTGHSTQAEYTFKKVGSVFQITHVGSGLSLDLSGNSAKDGAAIILWTGSDGPNQKWDFQPHA